MTSADFLRAVWPESGPYALAIPFQIPGTTTTVYAHKVFDTIAEAAAFAQRARAQTDIFFCVHALREPRVWNPRKPDRKTGTLGAYEVRTQRNMRAARCLFFDLDIGPDEDKYPDQATAIEALDRFTAETRLPPPMLVSSGRGIHAYWRLTESIPSDDWRQLATRLKRLANAHMLRVDPMRTTDTASVLRVAGTFNLKDRENPKPVKVLRPSEPLTPEAMAQHLQTGLILVGAPSEALESRPVAAPPPGSEELGSNLDRVYDGPPVSLKALGRVCGQVRAFAKALGNVTEPAWYAMLQLIRHVEDGEEWCHKLSAGHPNYTREETDRKLAHLKDRDVGPTTCAVIAERCGNAICDTCPHAGRIKSPLAAARLKDPAPAPVLPVEALVEEVVQLPDPPPPFIRLKSGGVGMIHTNRDGDEVTMVIYSHDLYPIRRIVDADRGIEQQMWRVHLPRGEVKDFVIDAASLYRGDVLASQLSNNGVYPRPAHVKEIQEYMSAYISELQKQQAADPSHNTLGWHDDFTRFVLPARSFTRDGKVIPAQLTQHAESSSHSISKAGTLERQVELLRFYQHPQYQAHQFLVLASLAAPLFHMTGHHGVVVNATGEPGASKSTSLYTAASLWAHPTKFPLNGTNHGATQKARAQRMVTMGSLPVCVDEITTMHPRDAQELVMNVTQPEGRVGLTRDGKERRPGGGEKSTIMICTANNSLHSLLSHENAAGTAGSMRVIELRMRPGNAHQKHEADDYLYALRENYGHVGELFIAHVVTHYDAVIARVRNKMKQIDKEVAVQAAERFWSAGIAAVLVAGEIAQELRLIAYDMRMLHQWAVTDLMSSMRGVIVAEYGSSASILADYLELVSGQILITGRGASGPYVMRGPTGPVAGHFDWETKVLAVSKKGFKDYCSKVGADLTKILSELQHITYLPDGRAMRMVLDPHARVIMGRGTEYAKMQSRCFLLDMKHPEITGAVNLSVVGDSQTATAPVKGATRAVT
jgi:hypothetical protein